MNKLLSFRPPEHIREELRRISKKRGLTMNALLITILTDWAKAEQPEERENEKKGA